VLGTELLPLVVFALSYWRDPRKFRTALYLLAAVFWLALSLFGPTFGAIGAWNAHVAGLMIVAVVLLAAAMVAGFAIFLVITGITLLRREGFAISRLLSLGLGTVLLAYLAAVVAVVLNDSVMGFVWLFLIGLPAGYLGFAFTAFLLYGSLYPALMARSGGPVAAVVVLGSGLIQGRVPPLLASRLRRGREVFDRAGGVGAQVQLVTSGGRGSDEPVAEATAMAQFLVDEGLPAGSVLAEDTSRNTQENLANTQRLLAERGLTGPLAVVTSDFHAFRAALLMRRLGLAGYAVGAPTARYYWPSAVIREFIAILRDHFWLNAVLLGLSVIPLPVMVVGSLTGR